MVCAAVVAKGGCLANAGTAQRWRWVGSQGFQQRGNLSGAAPGAGAAERERAPEQQRGPRQPAGRQPQEPLRDLAALWWAQLPGPGHRGNGNRHRGAGCLDRVSILGMPQARGCLLEPDCHRHHFTFVWQHIAGSASCRDLHHRTHTVRGAWRRRLLSRGCCSDDQWLCAASPLPDDMHLLQEERQGRGGRAGRAR